MKGAVEGPRHEVESLVSTVADGITRPTSERIYFEVNLLKLSGVLFCLDKAEAARRKGGVFDFEKLTAEPVTITPNPIFGYPSTLACKVCDAILKKLSDYGQPVPDHVSFTKRELDDLVGHTSWGGRNAAQLGRALYQLQGTTITARFFDKRSGRWNVSSFSVLSEVLIAGRGQVIQACSVRPNPLIIESLRAKHYACLNYERMHSLDVVGRQMFKRVFYHLSNLYDGRNRASLHYTKDYGAICREWLGGLKELRYISKIEQEQLGPHMRAMQACGLISSYKIERNARRDGFNVVFKPGKGFFDDYARFYASGDQRVLRFALATDEYRIQRPLELIAHFYKCLYRVDALSPTTFTDKETALASEILEDMPFDEARAFVEYAVREAAATKFQMKTFGAVRPYIAAWEGTKARREKAAAARAEHEARERAEALHVRYEAFRANAIEELRHSLAPELLADIETEAERSERGRKFGGALMARLKANQIIADRFRVPSFEDWMARGRAADETHRI